MEKLEKSKKLTIVSAKIPYYLKKAAIDMSIEDFGSKNFSRFISELLRDEAKRRGKSI